MEKTPLGEYILNLKDSIFVGHMGHKTKRPTDSEIKILVDIIESYEPKHYFVCREDPDDYSHLHYCIMEPNKDFDMSKFRQLVLKSIPRMKREGRGGETPLTLSKATKVEKQFKNTILNIDEQILYKVTYQVKYINEVENFYKFSEIESNEINDEYVCVKQHPDREHNKKLGLTMSELYWKINSHVNKQLDLIKKKSKPQVKIIKERIQIFFETKTQYTKTFGPLSQSPDLSLIVEILALFYQTEGADLPHTCETVERYALWLLGNYNPELHTKLLVNKIVNKYQNKNLN